MTAQAQPAPDTEAVQQVDPAILVQRFWEEVWRYGHYEKIDDMVAEDFVLHSAGEDISPREVFKDWVKSFRSAIGSIEFVVQDVFASGGRVCSRWTLSGQHAGPLLGIAGTGNHIRFTGLTVFYVEQGRLIEGWVERDAWRLARQIGAMPQAQADLTG